MRALTLWQPYATSVASGSKDIENRPKPPPRKLLRALEPIAIHAGLRYAEPGSKGWPYPEGEPVPPREDCPLGAIIGVATMVGYLNTSARSSQGRLFREAVPAAPDRRLHSRLERLDSERWWVGPVGILLVARRALTEPIPCRGALGFWTVPEDIERLILERLPR